MPEFFRTFLLDLEGDEAADLYDWLDSITNGKAVDQMRALLERDEEDDN